MEINKNRDLAREHSTGWTHFSVLKKGFPTHFQPQTPRFLLVLAQFWMCFCVFSAIERTEHSNPVFTPSFHPVYLKLKKLSELPL